MAVKFTKNLTTILRHISNMKIILQILVSRPKRNLKTKKHLSGFWRPPDALSLECKILKIPVIG